MANTPRPAPGRGSWIAESDMPRTDPEGQGRMHIDTADRRRGPILISTSFRVAPLGFLGHLSRIDIHEHQGSCVHQHQKWRGGRIANGKVQLGRSSNMPVFRHILTIVRWSRIPCTLIIDSATVVDEQPVGHGARHHTHKQINTTF